MPGANDVGPPTAAVEAIEEPMPVHRIVEPTALFRTIFQEHGLALSVVLLHALLAHAGDAFGLFSLRRDLIDFGYVRMLVLAAVLWTPVLLAAEIHRTGNLAGAIGSFRERYLRPSTLLGVIVAALIFAHSALVHDAWKQLLGVVNPYTWDLRLAVIDRAIHGVDPWRITHSVLG